jgi:hypothetical protein
MTARDDLLVLDRHVDDLERIAAELNRLGDDVLDEEFTDRRDWQLRRIAQRLEKIGAVFRSDVMDRSDQ